MLHLLIVPYVTVRGKACCYNILSFESPHTLFSLPLFNSIFSPFFFWYVYLIGPAMSTMDTIFNWSLCAIALSTYVKSGYNVHLLEMTWEWHIIW